MNNPSQEKFPVLSFLTPNEDLMFWEKVDLKMQRNRDFSYGQPHADTVRFPDHELVHVRPLDQGGQWFQFYYAAKREAQDNYNYQIRNGEELVRTYVIKRSLYYSNPVGYVDAVEGEFLYPPAGAASPDEVFPMYCFADDSLQRVDEILDSQYVVIQRRFIDPESIEYIYNETLERMVKVTKTIIPASDTAPPASSPGSTTEQRDGNYFHDVLINQEIVLNDGESYPYELSSLPAVYNRRFPSKLEEVELIWAWAWADSTTAAQSYNQDYYFKFKITDARPGPYEAVVQRFITDDPSTIQTSYPITIVPQPVTESIGVTSAWFYASTQGNSTSATAKEWAIPSTIHEEITINMNGDPLLPAGVPSTLESFWTKTLDVTPGATDFFSLTNATVDFQVKRMPLGLYEVSVITIDIDNLYTEAP